MPAPFDLSRLSLPVNLSPANAKHHVLIEMGCDDPGDRLRLFEMFDWLISETTAPCCRWTTPHRDEWGFGFVSDVDAVHFKLRFC